jgi:hypothetical protein
MRHSYAKSLKPQSDDLFRQVLPDDARHAAVTNYGKPLPDILSESKRQR